MDEEHVVLATTERFEYRDRINVALRTDNWNVGARIIGRFTKPWRRDVRHDRSRIQRIARDDVDELQRIFFDAFIIEFRIELTRPLNTHDQRCTTIQP